MSLKQCVSHARGLGLARLPHRRSVSHVWPVAVTLPNRLSYILCLHGQGAQSPGLLSMQTLWHWDLAWALWALPVPCGPRGWVPTASCLMQLAFPHNSVMGIVALPCSRYWLFMYIYIHTPLILCPVPPVRSCCPSDVPCPTPPPEHGSLGIKGWQFLLVFLEGNGLRGSIAFLVHHMLFVHLVLFLNFI